MAKTSETYNEAKARLKTAMAYITFFAALFFLFFEIRLLLGIISIADTPPLAFHSMLIVVSFCFGFFAGGIPMGWKRTANYIPLRPAGAVPVFLFYLTVFVVRMVIALIVGWVLCIHYVLKFIMLYIKENRGKL